MTWSVPTASPREPEVEAMDQQAVNPYAPPRAQLDPNLRGADYWIDGDTIVVRKGGTLPADRCVRTGQVGDVEVWTRTFQWVPRWVPMLVLVAWPIYFIAYFLTRKSGQISFGAGPELKTRRAIGIGVGWGGGALSALLLVLGITQDEPVLLLVGLIGILAAIIAGAVLVQPFRVLKIDEEHLYIKPTRGFLESLGAR
jgi:hypothetical protein